MTRIAEWAQAFAQIFRSRYVRELESEVARLRVENRALVNSLLGTAGVPPLEIEEPARLPTRMPAASGLGGSVSRGLASSAGGKGTAGPGSFGKIAVPPVRRRSWQQLGRMLEIEEARRDREHAARLARAGDSSAGRSSAPAGVAELARRSGISAKVGPSGKLDAPISKVNGSG